MMKAIPSVELLSLLVSGVALIQDSPDAEAWPLDSGSEHLGHSMMEEQEQKVELPRDESKGEPPPWITLQKITAWGQRGADFDLQSLIIVDRLGCTLWDKEIKEWAKIAAIPHQQEYRKQYKQHGRHSYKIVEVEWTCQENKDGWCLPDSYGTFGATKKMFFYQSSGQNSGASMAGTWTPFLGAIWKREKGKSRQSTQAWGPWHSWFHKLPCHSCRDWNVTEEAEDRGFDVARFGSIHTDEQPYISPAEALALSWELDRRESAGTDTSRGLWASEAGREIETTMNLNNAFASANNTRFPSPFPQLEPGGLEAYTEAQFFFKKEYMDYVAHVVNHEAERVQLAKPCKQGDQQVQKIKAELAQWRAELASIRAMSEQHWKEVIERDRRRLELEAQARPTRSVQGAQAAQTGTLKDKILSLLGKKSA